MERATEIRLRFQRFLIMSLALVVGFYSLSNGYNGTYGLRHLRQLESEEMALAEQARLIRDQRFELEGRIQSLSSHRLDPDLLEESARNQLGFVDKDEIVIFK